jgi:hypothetical protein
MLPAGAAAPAVRNLRAEDQADVAAPEDAADRADQVVRMDPAVVVPAETHCFRKTHRVLLAVS